VTKLRPSYAPLRGFTVERAELRRAKRRGLVHDGTTYARGTVTLHFTRGLPVVICGWTDAPAPKGAPYG